MKKSTLNNKGFGLIGVLAVIVVLAVAGGAGAYVYHHNHKTKAKAVASTSNTTTKKSAASAKTTTPAPISTSAATQVIKTFYSQYVALEKTAPPQATQASQLVQQYGTANLVSYYTPKPGYSYYENPIVCAQALPNTFSVSDVTSTSTNATGTVTETFGSNSVRIVVGVVSESGSLKIDSVTCSPRMVAQKGGE